jgi:hypothetical protein
MARVEGFEPVNSGQEPVDGNGTPVPVGVWGDSDSGVGVFGTSGALPSGVNNIATNLAGVEGHSIANPGVFGESVENPGVIGRSQSGSGVLGVTFAPTNDSHGVFGVSTVGGNGVVGFVGDATGVVGNSVRGTGVRGVSGAGHGVVGESVGGVRAAGVYGTSTEGVAGVWGNCTSRTGVQGESDSGTGTVGLSETATGVFGVSTRGTGVWGHCAGGDRGDGVIGTSGSGNGVRGQSVSGNGVYGLSINGGFGVYGESVRSDGVVGVSRADVIDPVTHAGVVGAHTSNGTGIYGESVFGYAAYFVGDVRVVGNLQKPGGQFIIDHPLDPANKTLSHSFVESPDMLNVYNGNVTTDAKGEASVTLPEYFEALNRDFRYQLTVIGQFAQAIVAEEIRNNQFTIKTDHPRVKVSWQVTGIRQDRWAVANRIAVEEEKAAEERGRYLHPELWGQPKEARVHRSPQRENQLRRVSQLVPEPLRPRVEQRLQALLPGDPVDREALQGLLREARQLAEPPLPEEPPRIDRARLEEEWRQVEELVQRMHQRTPWRGAEGPTSPESH